MGNIDIAYGRILISAVFLWVMSSVHSAQSHPISLSWAKVNINNTEMTIQLTMPIENLVFFYNPDPDEFFNYSSDTLYRLAENYKSKVLETLYVLDQNEQRLNSILMGLIMPNLPNQVSTMDLMKHELAYTIKVDHKSPHWEKFYFQHRQTNTSNGIPSVTFLTAFWNGKQLVKSTEITPNKPLVLWSTKSNEKISHSKLTSSYLSLTTRGLRHELTLPFSTFRAFSGANNPLSPKEVIKYFDQNNAIHYGPEKLSPKLSYMKTIESSNAENGLIYLDLIYPSTEYPSSIQVTWEDYNWEFLWFDGQISINDSTYIHRFSRFQTNWIWQQERLND